MEFIEVFHSFQHDLLGLFSPGSVASNVRNILAKIIKNW